MQLDLRQPARTALACFLVVIFAIPPSLLAESHVVNPADLQKAVTSAAQERQQNLRKVQDLFSSPRAEKALKSANMEPAQVKDAAATLDDAELAQLASRADKMRADFSAGNLSDRDLIVILIAIAALILIVVAVR
jgi:hypothetical protein